MAPSLQVRLMAETASDDEEDDGEVDPQELSREISLTVIPALPRCPAAPLALLAHGLMGWTWRREH